MRSIQMVLTNLNSASQEYTWFFNRQRTRLIR